MKHAIIPGVMERSVDPRKLVDPFAPGGDAHRNFGPTHEDMAGGPFVLLENVEVRIEGAAKPWVVFLPFSYRREAAEAWRGGPVRGMRPLVSFVMNGRDGVTRAGSQQELELRYGWFSRGDYRGAVRKAKRLLLEHLNPLQRLFWEWGSFFYVLGEVNELYRIEEGNGVAVVDPYTHWARLHLCYHPETFMPHEDVALATKLLIESGPEGEELLLKTARTRVVTNNPRHTPNAVTRDLRAMERELLAA